VAHVTWRKSAAVAHLAEQLGGNARHLQDLGGGGTLCEGTWSNLDGDLRKQRPSRRRQELDRPPTVTVQQQHHEPDIPRNHVDGEVSGEAVDNRQKLMMAVVEEEQPKSSGSTREGKNKTLTLKVGFVYYVRNSNCIHLRTRSPNIYMYMKGKIYKEPPKRI
jgi:hypothetical protein